MTDNNNNINLDKAKSCTVCLESFESVRESVICKTATSENSLQTRTQDGARCPRTLPCGHTLCTGCLQTQIGAKRTISCPTCRAEHAVSGADAVPKAFALIELLNAVKNRVAVGDDDETTDRAAPAPPANADGVQINVTAQQIAGGNGSVADVLIKLVPPSGTRRTPGDYALVIDISGSMGVEAKLKNESGQSESHGLSLLDVVKHAATTVANVLGDDDRLALVAYSSQSTVVLPLTNMNAAGKKKALEEIGLLHPDDMTNMWAGIQDGIKQLAAAKDSGRASYVFVLTDGQPNVEPARGHIRALDDLCKSLEWRCTMSTFGFGYGIESPLLRNLAVVTGGNYIFIPDSSFVGTAFVNAVAHALTTVGQQARVTIVPQNGATLVDADAETLGGHQVVGRHDGAVTLGIGAIGADTHKHVVVRMQLPPVDTKDPEKPYCEVTLDYNGTTGASLKPVQRVALGYRRDGGDDVAGAALPHRVHRGARQDEPGDDVVDGARQGAGGGARARRLDGAAEQEQGGRRSDRRPERPDHRGVPALRLVQSLGQALHSVAVPLARARGLLQLQGRRPAGLRRPALREDAADRRRHLLQAAGAQAGAAASRGAQGDEHVGAKRRGRRRRRRRRSRCRPTTRRPARASRSRRACSSPAASASWRAKCAAAISCARRRAARRACSASCAPCRRAASLTS
jgi:Mg-chelatase subunit ChlD